MTGFALLRERLLDLRRQTLAVLAKRSEDEVVDAGLLALVATIQATLAALDEEAGRKP